MNCSRLLLHLLIIILVSSAQPHCNAAMSLTNSTVTGNTAGDDGGLGEETIGNKPFDGANFTDWPGIMPVINNKSRVYHSWVNGDERFYFSPTTEQLNQLLADFGKLKGKREVLIVPQTENVSTFDKSQSFQFNCQLHLVGGVAKHIAGKDKGEIFWPLKPQLTIHVTPNTELAKLTIPKNVNLVSLAEIKARYKNGLESDAQEVRGWGIGFLAKADPYDGESLKTIADLIVDTDQWVASNALGSIESFGPKVKDYLDTLKKIADSEFKNAAKAKKLLPKIEAAMEKEATKEFEKAERIFRQQENQANSFINRIRGV